MVWRARHTSLPHTLSFCLLSSSVCLFVSASSRSHTSQQQPRKPHLAYISSPHMNNTATLKILFFIWGIFDGEVTLVSALQIQTCPLLFSFFYFLRILKCSNGEIKFGPSLVYLFVFLMYVSDCKSNPDVVASAEGIPVTHTHTHTQ